MHNTMEHNNHTKFEHSVQNFARQNYSRDVTCKQKKVIQYADEHVSSIHITENHMKNQQCVKIQRLYPKTSATGATHSLIIAVLR